MILYDAHTHCSKEKTKDYSVCNLIVRCNSDSEIEPNRLFSIGIHPWYLEDAEQQFKQVKQMAQLTNCLAIGECGIDKNVSKEVDYQKRIFIKQIQLSESIRKPLIVHSVRSYSEILNIRKELQVSQKWLIHSFNSSWQMAESLLKSGCYLSVGKLLFHNSSKSKYLIKRIALERLLIESDEREYSILTYYKAIAALRGISLEDLIKIQKKNFENFYNISCS